MDLAKHHAGLKATRMRGHDTPARLAMLLYLCKLEREHAILERRDPLAMDAVRDRLFRALRCFESDHRQCSRWLDEAQQRMHRSINRMRHAC